MNQRIWITARVLSFTMTAMVFAARALAVTVATPVFSPPAGTYTAYKSVTLSDATAGATIHYTTNGTLPTASSTKYTGVPIPVTKTETIKAIAVKTGDTSSAVASATYTLQTATPVFTPKAGTSSKELNVTLSDSTAGAVIHYTTNGTTPTTSSTKYVGAIQVFTTETIRAIAVATGRTESAVASATYTITTTATPVFAPTAGTYTIPPSVSISDATPGAVIHYTTNGTTPTTSSTRYSTPIKLSHSETIKAIAVASGRAKSLLASATYDIRTFTIGGKVIGLRGGGTVTLLNGTSIVSLLRNGSFTFAGAQISGTAYKVSVEAHSTGQTCALQNGSGTVGSVDVTNIVVYCTFNVTAATLDGSYYFASFNISKYADELYDVNFNGAGNYDGNLTANVNGAISSSTATGTYTVAPNSEQIRVLTSGGNNIGGILGADGDAFVWLANTSNGQLPALVAGVKALQGGSAASVDGHWTGVTLEGGASKPLDDQLISVTFSSGTFSGTKTQNTGGTITTGSVSGSYTLSANGALAAGPYFRGAVGADRDLAVLADIVSGEPGTTILVRQGTGVSDATANGVYAVVGLGPTNKASDGALYTIFLDGAGHYSGTYVDNHNGNVTTGNLASGTYSVNSDGKLIAVGSDGKTYDGALSADGNAMVLAGVTSGEKPTIFVGVRQ